MQGIRPRVGASPAASEGQKDQEWEHRKVSQNLKKGEKGEGIYWLVSGKLRPLKSGGRQKKINA